ncbi:hypothetical protein [Gracilibacillus sp. YIM 98692]|uniref:hypothetical protein n=1 Tax=Gracilibacillus sp. YIM 98692 TaxID=2663532 RepID=UPI0032048B03
MTIPVFQFSIPGKGKFTLVLQEEDDQSIKFEAEENPELKRMLKESQEQYEHGHGISTTGLLKSLSKKKLNENDVFILAVLLPGEN